LISCPCPVPAREYTNRIILPAKYLSLLWALYPKVAELTPSINKTGIGAAIITNPIGIVYSEYDRFNGMELPINDSSYHQEIGAALV
jgi:hypothetical protein